MAGRPGSAPLPITASRAAHLWDALGRAYDLHRFDKAAGGDEVFRQLVLARIIEPTSKAESLRVLEETGVGGPHLQLLRAVGDAPLRHPGDCPATCPGGMSCGSGTSTASGTSRTARTLSGRWWW